ncbi:Uncharacterised protein [Mycobacteroides abscessus subsp. abscessus]|nr:Uncharacterised protein [Mycobacteroides abscessus subsp. abscessus]SKU36086.1 Uncharacterised protein [Mycobacteroides abscessus subsp. abscessus]
MTEFGPLPPPVPPHALTAATSTAIEAHFRICIHQGDFMLRFQIRRRTMSGNSTTECTI